MVTYMILWMRRHARDLKGDLEKQAGSALAKGSAKALVLMAFLAVLREGFETVVFLLATFHASGNATVSWLGALLGILLAVVLGYGIYKGGIHINLATVLPDYRHRSGGYRRRAGHDCGAHGQRSRLVELRSDPSLRPLVVGAARHPARVVRDRRPRDPAVPGVDRGHRLAGLSRADAARSCAGRPRSEPPAPTGVAPGPAVPPLMRAITISAQSDDAQPTTKE